MSEGVIRSRGKDVSEFKKGQIIGLYQGQKRCKEIAEITGIGLRTVQRIIKAWKEVGEPTSSRKMCGRKRILNNRDRRSLKRLVKSDRRKSTLQLTNIFIQGCKTISTRTMRRELKGMGLNSCVATRKPLVNEINRKKRLQFAKQHKDWTPEQWRKIMWSDESRFTLFQHDGRIRVRREAHEALDPSCTVPTVQASGGSVMIWGCFCWAGLGSATICSNKMKSPEYVSLLSDHLIPSMKFFFPEDDGVFQDDNAKIHRAGIVKDWFIEHADSFSHLNWPPQSPDINPIENLWDVLERTLRNDCTLPSSIEDLGKKLMLMWPNISVETLHAFIETMPRRMRAVIRAKGGPTKY